MQYLASDELKGRGIGTAEIDIAARYIAQFFQKAGLSPVAGSEGYYQEFKLVRKQAPTKIEFSFGEHIYKMNEELVLVNGTDQEYKNADVIFADFISEQHVKDQRLKGKIVVSKLGFPEQDVMENYFPMIDKKRTLAQEAGALALVEIYKSKSVPWERIIQYFGSDGGIDIEGSSSRFPHLLLNDRSDNVKAILKSQISGNLSIEAESSDGFAVKNVIAFLEGSDPSKNQEVIMLGAHYDHVGIGRAIADENGDLDSIYNGARDNASGTVALMMAAKEFAENPPKRPVLFAAFTAEESGLIGSRYFADHPAIPLEHIAFYLNNDNGGYNDTSIATLVGASRSNASEWIEPAINSAGLEMYSSAELDQTFFGASDNISLSSKGIPSATYSLGFRAMDEEIRKYYHQPSDEVETLDMKYLTQWIRGYINAAVIITNMQERPFWTEGDPFEQAGKELYQID